jgi:hypothetical protein
LFSDRKALENKAKQALAAFLLKVSQVFERAK